MAETGTSVTVSGSSGANCTKAGPYMCSTHTDTVLFVRDGKAFPNCPVSRNKKGHSTTWKMAAEGMTLAPSPIDNLETVAL